MTDGPSRPQAVVFDWDNTLVDTWPTIHESLSATFQAMGREPWSFDETRARVRHSLREAFPALFGDRWIEARDIFYATFERSHIERLVVIEGALELLKSLSGAGIELAVLSNKTGRYLRDEVEHLGWAGYFAAVVGAGDATRDKPDPEALALALAGTRCKPGPEVWFVGDSGIDMEAAHRTGCTPVLLHRHDLDSAEFRDWPPEYSFDGCITFMKFVA